MYSHQMLIQSRTWTILIHITEKTKFVETKIISEFWWAFEKLSYRSRRLESFTMIVFCSVFLLDMKTSLWKNYPRSKKEII